MCLYSVLGKKVQRISMCLHFFIVARLNSDSVFGHDCNKKVSNEVYLYACNAIISVRNTL